MFERVYTNPVAKSQEGKVEDMIKNLYQYYLGHLDKLPEYQVSLITGLSQLPSDESVNPVDMICCVGAVGAALNLVEGL